MRCQPLKAAELLFHNRDWQMRIDGSQKEWLRVDFLVKRWAL